MSQTTNEAVHLGPIVELATESVEALYFALNGLPNLSNLFAELQTQLQAMRTVLRSLNEVPDAVTLDTKVISIVETYGKSCVSVKESIERCWQSGNPDWSAFQDGTDDTAAIVRKLRLYTSTVVVGGLKDLTSKGHITLSAEGWKEYEKLVADAHIHLEDHVNDLVRRMEDIERSEQVLVTN